MSDWSQRRKSLRLKDIHVIYSEDRETDFVPLKCIKTEFIDPEEATSCPIGSRSCSGAILALPSPSETAASVADNEVEKDVSLKDLRARYKAKILKSQKLSMNLENEKPDEEVDLDEPLIALKQKRQKTFLRKAKKKIDAPASPHLANIEDTMSKRDRTSPIQACSPDTTLHYSRAVKPRRRAPDLEHSEIENAIDHSKEMFREDICSAEMENRICCRIETEVHEEAAVSTFCEKNSFEHSCVEMHQVPVEDNGCVNSLVSSSNQLN